MKIAIPADKPDLEAKVGTRLGTSQYLLIVDLKTMARTKINLPVVDGIHWDTIYQPNFYTG